MMSRKLGLLALVWIGAMPLGAMAGEARQPFEMVRDLQQLQDHIAAGDAIAQAAHARGIERAARAFAKASPTTWSDARNARALAVYLFSGGNASMIGDAVPESVIVAKERPLYAGAIAYGLGDDAKARKQLMPIDAKSLPGVVGAQLALVQATLICEDDKSKAIALLDLSRLLAPGTLIEEAALRKEMSLIGASGDLDKYGLLARRYLGAYSHSVYADNFRQLVAAAALQIGAGDTDEAVRQVAKLALSLGKDERRKVYLAIAKEAVLSGRIRMAVLASEEAVRLAQRGSPDETKAMVYFGAAAIVGDRYDVGRKTLSIAASDQLSPADLSLRTSALAVAEMIRRPAAAGAVGVEAAHAGIAADAERSLAASDETLKRASQ